MAVVAATIQEAIDNTVSRIGVLNRINFLQIRFSLFTSGWADIVSNDTEAGRTVTNWRPLSSALAGALPASGDAQQVQNAADNIVRVLSAVQAAEAAGRITSAERDQFIVVWNAWIGAD